MPISGPTTGLGTMFFGPNDSNVTNLGSSGASTSSAGTSSGGSVGNAMSSLLAQLGTIFNGAQTPNPDTVMQNALGYQQQTASQNAATLTALLPNVINAATATGQQLDQYIQGMTIDTMNKIAPGWQQAMSAMTAAPQEVRSFVSNFMGAVYPQAVANLNQLGQTATQQSNQMMLGNTPADMIQKVRMGSAESAIAGLGQSGASGPSTGSSNLLAKNLGLTSLQVMQAGQSMAGTASDMYKQLESLGTSGASMIGMPTTLGAQAATGIKALMPDLTDVGALTNGLFSTIGSATTTNPSNTLSAYMTAQSNATEADWVKRLSYANALVGLTGTGMGYNVGQGLFSRGF